MEKETKQCRSCGEVLDVSAFGVCKARKDGLQSYCKPCTNAKNRTSYHKDADKHKARSRKYYEEHKEEHAARTKKWRENNTDRANELARNWMRENNDELRERRNKRDEENPERKVKNSARAMVSKALKEFSETKQDKTIEYIGCSIAEYRSYLEGYFEEGMTWENYGEWHIDHTTPLAYANNVEEVVELLHYTNTRPMWAAENLSKGSLHNGKRHNYGKYHK